MIAFNRRQRAGSDDVSDDGGNGGEFDIYNWVGLSVSRIHIVDPDVRP